MPHRGSAAAPKRRSWHRSFRRAPPRSPVWARLRLSFSDTGQSVRHPPSTCAGVTKAHPAADFLRAYGLAPVERPPYSVVYRTPQIGDKRSASSLDSDPDDEDDASSPNSMVPLYVATPKVGCSQCTLLLMLTSVLFPLRFQSIGASHQSRLHSSWSPTNTPSLAENGRPNPKRARV